MIRSFIASLKQEFSGYNAKSFSRDLMAGVTVAAVALPLALAFGVSSGADAASGLITAIIAGVVIGSLSGAFFQISGPTGAMAAILVSIVSKYQMQGVFLATLLAGVFLLLAGILRLGKMTAYIPAPVITGFTSGIAILIAAGQLDNLFGVKSIGENLIDRIASYAELGFHPNLFAFCVGLFVILFMIAYPKKWNAIVPGSLVAIILATAFVSLLKFDVARVGEIPKTLLPAERLNLSEIKLTTLLHLLSPAFSIAMLGMIESLLCGSSASRMTGKSFNSDQELIAQGIGNIVVPFFGGIPATAAIARTSVAVKSGAVTRLTSIVHALVLVVSMFLLAPVMSAIPLSALAGVLMVTAFRMNEWHSIRYMFSRKFKGAILKYLVTMVATVVFDLTTAIALGVLVALLLLVRRLSKIEINLEAVDATRLSADGEEICRRFGNARVVYLSGAMIFANTQVVEAIPASIPEGCDAVFFSMRGVSYLDVSCAQAFEGVIKALHARDIRVGACGLSSETRRTMERSGILSLIGEENVYWSIDRALTQDCDCKAEA
ncbi:MAG: SulP family inorganic anion transporter [Christensenella sp.]|nr:SulP family inorganic anion transporter [Christensenella sp.]